MEYDWDEITMTAKALGIKLTNATIDQETHKIQSLTKMQKTSSTKRATPHDTALIFAKCGNPLP
jgi:hypothetical protein